MSDDVDVDELDEMIQMDVDSEPVDSASTSACLHYIVRARCNGRGDLRELSVGFGRAGCASRGQPLDGTALQSHTIADNTGTTASKQRIPRLASYGQLVDAASGQHILICSQTAPGPPPPVNASNAFGADAPSALHHPCMLPPRLDSEWARPVVSHPGAALSTAPRLQRTICFYFEMYDIIDFPMNRIL